mgnify:CR=1 FL=1
MSEVFVGICLCFEELLWSVSMFVVSCGVLFVVGGIHQEMWCVHVTTNIPLTNYYHHAACQMLLGCQNYVDS